MKENVPLNILKAHMCSLKRMVCFLHFFLPPQKQTNKNKNKIDQKLVLRVKTNTLLCLVLSIAFSETALNSYR